MGHPVALLQISGEDFASYLLPDICTPRESGRDRVVQQRKLLYLEKLFASLLLSGPRVKNQLNSRVAELSAACDDMETVTSS